MTKLSRKPNESLRGTTIADRSVPLEAVLCNDELSRRPKRLPDYETENRALAKLVQALADSPQTILQTLSDTILELFRAGSAGVSLLSKDETNFYWPAISGAWSAHISGGTPRDFGPCGDVLDCNGPLLFKQLARRYTYFQAVPPTVEEALLVPFFVAGKALGTIWVVTHDDRRPFDAEDLRLLESLGRFASAAYRVVESTEEFREGEERYRTLFDLSPIGIYSIDASGVIQKYNSQAVKLWGRTPVPGDTDERFCGSFKLYRPDGTFLPHDQCPMAEMVSGKIAELLNAEVQIERLDGSRISVIVNIRSLKNGRGDIVGAINCFYDITERRRMEKALRDSDELNRSMIESSPDCIKVLGLEGNLISMQCGHDLLGIEDIGPYLNTSWIEFWHGDDRVSAREAVEQACKATGGKAANFVGYFRTLRGEPKWWDVSISPILDASGKPSQLLAVSRDVTQRTKDVDALRESQSRLRYAADAAGLTYVEVELESGTARKAENFGAVMGYSVPNEPVTEVFEDTRLLIEHIVPEDRANVERALADFLSGKPVGKIEYRVLGDDCVERWIESRWSLERDGNGKPLKTFAINLDITDRKRAEEKFRVLLESAPDAMVIIKGDGRIALINAQTEKLFGYTRGELVGQPVEVLIPQRFRDRHPGHRLAFLENPKLRPMGAGRELWAARQDGTEFPVEISLSPLETEAGILVTAAIRDITDRKHVEEILQESQRFLRSSLDALSGQIAVLDESGTILEVNEAWRRFADENQFAAANYGVGSSYLVDEVQIAPEECNLPTCTEGIRDVIDGRRTAFELEYPCHSLTAQRWYMMRVTRFESPGPVRVVIVHDNITARKRAEMQLQQNHDTFNNLIESSPFGLYIVDAQFRMMKVSAAAQKVFRNIHPLIDRDFEEIMSILWPEEFVRMVIGRFHHTLETGEPFAMRNFSEQRQDNAYVESYDWKIERITLPDGQFGVVCYFYDITERKLAEVKLQEQTEALADLHRRKDEFLAMLSHELRSPIAPISNAVHLLRLQSNEDALQKQARGVIERQVGQLTRLVDDLMEVSRITTGRVHLRKERIVIGGIIERAVETTFPMMEQRRHTLIVNVPPEPIWLDADAGRLEQVIVNLLTNSAKYTEEGGRIWLTVEVSGERKLPDVPTECIIRIRDTGVGIAPGLLPRVFDLFTQAERSLDRSQGGLGIGLALVQRLVEMHGGTVEVTSTLGKGSEFVVRLPISKDEMKRMKNEPHVDSSFIAHPLSLKVLIVDDNDDSAETLAMLLKALKHDVRTANDGLAALEAASNYRPDVVLLDIGLPMMDGYEVAAKMRLSPAHKTTVLVALTGYGQDSDRQKSKDAGFDHHLVKPADFAKLQQILTRASERAKH